MSDADDLARVRAILKESGLFVESVPESQSRRCDLRARDDVEQYLIEVKGVHDNEEVASMLRECGTYHGDRVVPRSPPLLRRIETALKQIRETAGGAHDALWLVALIERGPLWSGVIFKDIIATLYGLRSLVDLGPPPRPLGKCLYFSGGAFHKHRLDLDGAIIIGSTGAGMCVNDCSERARRLRESHLGRFFAEHQLLHDAERLAREGGFLVADCEIDRNDEHAVLQYLARKYGLARPIVLRDYAWLGAFSVPVSEL